MGYILRKIVYLTPWLLSDRQFIKLMWHVTNGGRLNLTFPVTFNEKVNWIKLNDRNSLYTTLVDKEKVKEYVADRIGPEYIIPTIGIWNSAKDIDFGSLPDSGFVLKCTHDSGSVLIVKDKSDQVIESVQSAFSRYLKRNYYRKYREWPYKNVPRRIIAEPYMSDLNGNINDYKFFCNYGKVKFLFVATERFSSDSETRFDFFDADFNHISLTNGHPMANEIPSRPIGYEKMVEIAERLSAGIPFVRVDLYNLDGKILFGEYTFSHWGGFKAFYPPEYDKLLGEMIDL